MNDTQGAIAGGLPRKLRSGNHKFHNALIHTYQMSVLPCTWRSHICTRGPAFRGALRLIERHDVAIGVPGGMSDQGQGDDQAKQSRHHAERDQEYDQQGP